MKIEIEKGEQGWSFTVTHGGVEIAQGYSVFYSRIEREIRECIETQMQPSFGRGSRLRNRPPS